MKRLISILLVLSAFSAFAQEAPQMADTMRENGKIYVVVLVLSIVFVCLATYLIIIDRKLKKLENKN
ncbi:MAG TPA: CcmD family protein [Bacteroidia bacterium]|jgi:hypothetical protein|nr:CcmD family protein [Bacteroidia bacterium]